MENKTDKMKQMYIAIDNIQIYHQDIQHVLLQNKIIKFDTSKKVKDLKKYIVNTLILDRIKFYTINDLIYLPKEKEFFDKFNFIINNTINCDDKSKLKDICDGGQYIDVKIIQNKKLVTVKYDVEQENSNNKYFIIFEDNTFNTIKRELKKCGIVTKYLSVNEEDVQLHSTIGSKYSDNRFLTVKNKMITDKDNKTLVEGQQYGTIYILQEREFINKNENVYKIGMTRHQPNKRLSKYPKDSQLFLAVACKNEKTCDIENELIKKFNSMFIQRNDIGNEYFQGDISVMMNEIFTTVCNN